ncbi:MAG: putative DNA binding domain-containing protein [bacterium]|nr:putative DNA binding domain-containing protein [Acidimicrobiia bacterium]MCY4650109.1 putative DNA binding domain-containing protein [bacterium]
MTFSYSDESIRRRLRLGEDSGWEFKEVEFRGDKPVLSTRNAWADEIAAFANARGGVFLIGVTDAGAVPGMSRGGLDEVERLIGEVCRDSIKPAIRVHIHRRELDKRSFLLVEIPEGHSQHDSPGGSYIRVGGSKQPMTPDERMRLAQRRGQARFIGVDEQMVAGTGFETFDERLWKPLLSVDSLADPVLGLEKLNLLATDEHGVARATVAGVLVCTEDPERFLPHAAINAVRYRGTDRASRQIDAQEIGGPVNRQIEQALGFVRRNMRVGARKDPAREDLPEYSLRAVFESLVNAVAHRDYSIRGSRIRLAIFSDRLEVCSPGSLPNNLTIDSMAERQSTRNGVLVSVLARMNVRGAEGAEGRRYFMERRGDGVPIIRRETKALTGKDPRFRLIDDSELCLTIPAAETEFGSATVTITVRRDHVPLAGADVLALFPNRTWKRGSTDVDGETRLDLHAVHLPMTVFVAGPGCAAHVEREWVPAQRSLAVDLAVLRGGGSVVFPEATGHIPGLAGRLNPILDTSNRTYLYASNIAINGGRQQPLSFIPGTEELHLMDADGGEFLVRVAAITGRSSILEYRPVSRTTDGHADRNH